MYDKIMLRNDMHNIVRGAIKIENRENLGQCPKRGGGVKNRNFPISIWEF